MLEPTDLAVRIVYHYRRPFARMTTLGISMAWMSRDVSADDK